MIGILGDSSEALAFAALLQKKLGQEALVVRSQALILSSALSINVDLEGSHCFTESILLQNFEANALRDREDIFWFIFDPQIPWGSLKGRKIFVVSKPSDMSLRMDFGALWLGWTVKKRGPRRFSVDRKLPVKAMGPSFREAIRVLRSLGFVIPEISPRRKLSSWQSWAFSLET